MAKRRTRRRSSSAPIVRTVRAPAQVIRVSAPRSSPIRHRRRKGSGGGGGSALSVQRLMAMGLGGMALGFIEKAIPQLPTIPILGRKGTIAVGAYYMSKGGHGPSILRDVAIVAAGLAGYELGTTGKISGDIPDQVHGGVAAQV
jgi:hypothetical protein